MTFLRALLLMLAGIGLMLAPEAQTRVNMADGRMSFADSVSKVAPAVVNIFAVKPVRGQDVRQQAEDKFFQDPLLRELLGVPPQPVQRGKTGAQQSLGSGVIVRSDGLLVTNYHVIEKAEDVQVTLADGRSYPVRFVNADPKLDLAVLRLVLPQGVTLPVAPFGDPETLQVGDVVLAIGNPFGLGQSVSMGVVSAVGRSNANISEYGRFIQTDATINPGNSGGALIDSNGRVMGINTAIFSKSGGSQGIGFAVPANLVQAVVRNIVATGNVERPWLGAVGQNISAALAQQLGLTTSSGVLVAEVMQGSPASKGGVKVGDIITRLNGAAISDPADLNEHIVTLPNLLTKPSSMEVIRNGQRLALDVQLEDRPDRQASDRRQVGGYSPLANHVIERLTPALNMELDIAMNAQGIAVVGIPANAQANPYALPFIVGDVVVNINGVPVTGLEQALELLRQSKRMWTVDIRRRGQPLKLSTQGN